MSGQQGSTFSGQPKGSVDTELLGNSYFSPAPSTPASAATKKAVLLCTDGSGLAVPNCKFIADALAKQLDCDVWIPDYFLGKPVIPPNFSFMPDRAWVKIPWWTYIKFFFMVALPNIRAILSNLPFLVDPRLESFVRQLKAQKKYERIGAVGYWYGASVCIRLASKPDLLNTVVICHPGKFTIKQVKNMKLPNSWVCCEGKIRRDSVVVFFLTLIVDDTFFPNTLRDKSEAEFASRKDKESFVEYEFKVYKGTAHGFAIRPNLDLPEIKIAFEGALEQTVGWFKKTL